MNTKRFLVIGTVAGAWMLGGCANNYNPDYSNVDPKSNYGRTSPYLDMSDAEECARQLIDDCLARQVNGQNWTDAFRAEKGRAPIIYVGTVRNRTDDPDLQTEQFTNMIEKELLNSGRVTVMSEREGRAELREERQDDVYRDPKYVKSNKAELGSDFVLRGEVLYFRQIARSGSGERVDYRVDMELTNVETGQKVWTKDGRIAKATSRQ
jgi:uncharacterized protein (TIGR02722 family)